MHGEALKYIEIYKNKSLTKYKDLIKTKM